MEDLKTENETLVSNTYLNVEQVQGNNTQQGLYAISVPINKVKNNKMKKLFTDIQRTNSERYSSESVDENLQKLSTKKDSASDMGEFGEATSS